jgi:hypothetical protein
MNDPSVGDVVENLTFEGYARIADGVLVNEGSIAPLSLSEMRDSGASYALIHTATVWCPSCRTAAADLAAQGDVLSNQGAVLIELLLEGNTGLLPNDNELNVWVGTSDLTVTTVRPGDARGPLVFPSREYVYLIELESMEVVWAEQALFTDPSITEKGIDALLDLL